MAACACALATKLAYSPAAQIAPGSNAAVQADRVASAVVQLLAVGPDSNGQNQDCSATGFLVNGEGYILTNAHVNSTLRGCLAKTPDAKIVAKFALAATAESRAAPHDGGIAPAVSCDLVGLDEVHDLAVMRTERPIPPGAAAYHPPQGGVSSNSYLTLENSEVDAGASIGVTGHPKFAWEAVSEFGLVVERRTLLLSGRNSPSTEMLILDLRLHRGNSGSPVYLPISGGVVGVVAGQDPRNSAQSVAVPIRYAIELLVRLNVKWHGRKFGD